MKKIVLVIIIMFISQVKVYSWETVINLDCVNENLEPCSSPNLMLDPINENESKVSNTLSNNKNIKPAAKTESNIIKDEIIKKNPVNEITKLKNSKEITKNDPVKNNNKVSLLTSSILSNEITDFDDNKTFDEFKAFLIKYTKETDYPNIDH